MRRRITLGLVGAAVLLAVLAGCLGAGPDAAGLPPTTVVPTSAPDADITPGPSAAGSRLDLEVVYGGMWSGAYGTRDAIKSNEGFGNATLPLPADATFIQAAFQKQESTNETLTLRLVRDGIVMKEASGSDPLAVVTLEASLG